MNPQRQRSIVVTGVGMVSAFGLGIEAAWSALTAGRSAAQLSPESLRAIPVPPWAGALGSISQRLEEVVEARYLRRLATISRLTVAAAVLCAREARLSLPPASPSPTSFGDATAVILGTSFGASSYHFEYYEKLFRGGLKDASPLLFSESVMNAASGHASIYLRLRGPSLALVGGEEVGLTAIMDAQDRLQLGEIDAAFAGGAEEYCDFVHAAVAASGLVESSSSTTPAAADGAFFSEGAALLLLETEAQARCRGAPILARWAGCAAARSLIGPEGTASAVERAVRAALEDAGVGAESVDLAVISAPRGAAAQAEAAGLARGLELGESEHRHVPICAPKALLGEGFGYTSAAMAAVAIRAIATGTIPPTPGKLDVLPPGLLFARVGGPQTLRCVLVIATSQRGNALAAVVTGD